jgi:hypothetical protein
MTSTGVVLVSLYEKNAWVSLFAVMALYRRSA